ncbi:MAG TPA: hypothetical protein VFI22_10980, partial [Thermomicrobiales bacterium]|nr:hypothetical protein [Thermomicrobiales bacterium]
LQIGRRLDREIVTLPEAAIDREPAGIDVARYGENDADRLADAELVGDMPVRNVEIELDVRRLAINLNFRIGATPAARRAGAAGSERDWSERADEERQRGRMPQSAPADSAAARTGGRNGASRWSGHGDAPPAQGGRARRARR